MNNNEFLGHGVYDEELKGCVYHHTAWKLGYVSRRRPEGILYSYKGRYGEGYIIERPSFKSTRFFLVDYYIKEEEA